MGRYLDKIRQHRGITQENGPDSFPLVPTGPAPAQDIVIELARRPDGSPLSPVFWETGSSQILGPAIPEFFAKVGTGPNEPYWVIVDYEGQPVWVLADRLRSRQQFERQRPLREVERIRELI